MIRPGARVMLLAGLALSYGAVALASGSDRDAIRNLSAEPTITPLAAHAWLQQARLALANRQPDAALAAAWKGLRAAPAEPSAASLLGSAYFMKGDTTRAHAAFSVARRFGWRDPATQAYWIGAGLAQYDLATTARHLDAMMRGAPGLLETRNLLVALESDPAGRSALTTRLREGPGWLDAYASSLADLPPSAFAQRISLLREAAVFNHRPNCQRITDSVNRLAYQALRYAEAAQLWQLACMPERRTLIGNGEFAAAPPEPATPFDWSLPGTGGANASFGDGALLVRNENPGLPVLAQQTILAPAGASLRLGWQATADGAAAGLDQLVVLRCPDGRIPRDTPRAARIAEDRWELLLRLPSTCAYQRIELRAPREAGEVRIERITAAVVAQ